MFGIEILDVAVGLIFVFLTLSLAVTAANEMFAAWFKRRAWMLRKGIENLIRDEEVTRQVLTHPLMLSLHEPKSRISGLPVLRSLFGTGPSYIQSRTFAVALLDTAAPLKDGKRQIAPEGAAARPVDAVLRVLWQEAEGNDEAFKKSIEVWFNDAMERVSGWYKRYTMLITIVCAIVVTVGTNADTLVISRALWSDPALRQAVVERAVKSSQPPSSPNKVAVVVDDAPPPPPLPPDQQADADFEQAEADLRAAVADLDELQLPIGWRDPRPQVVDEDAPLESVRLVKADSTDEWPGRIWSTGGSRRWLSAVDHHVVGWLITILAISLGAPFWFDMLNKVVSIRSAGKAPEESPKPPKEVPKPREPGPLTGDGS